MVKKATTAQSAETLAALPNIGPAMIRDFQQLGIHTPRDLIGKDPYALYLALCDFTGTRQDPCVLDTFIAVTRFMAGDPPHPWWHYTAERKRQFKKV